MSGPLDSPISLYFVIWNVKWEFCFDGGWYACFLLGYFCASPSPNIISSYRYGHPYGTRLLCTDLLNYLLDLGQHTVIEARKQDLTQCRNKTPLLSISPKWYVSAKLQESYSYGPHLPITLSGYFPCPASHGLFNLSARFTVWMFLTYLGVK